MGCGRALLALLASLGLASTIAAGQQTAPVLQTDHARLWQAYRNRFLSADGRVVDPQGAGRTTSEGQSYALFFALVNNDREHFDMALKWTQANLAAGDLGAHLPAWSWGQAKDGHWGVLDPNSASDSDIWIAYDLIEAGRLWHEPRYSALGRRLAMLAGRRESAILPGFGPVLLPGATGFKFANSWVLNPSYTPVFLLNRLAMLDPAGPWVGIALTTPKLMEQSARGGFAFDWVQYTPGQGFEPCTSTGPNAKKGTTPVGSYDAIRVYLWAGLLPESNPAKGKILAALPGMNQYLAQHPAPPEKINHDGTPEKQDGPVGFSAALLPYLKSIPNDVAAAQQLVRIKSQLDEKSNLYGAGYGTGSTYYDQNLVLFGLGWSDSAFRFGSSGELLVPWTHP